MTKYIWHLRLVDTKMWILQIRFDNLTRFPGRGSGRKPRHKSLSNEKLSNDQSNGTGLTSSNGVAALRRHEPTDYNTESTTGSASNLKPDRADNISGVYDIPASAYNVESIKNEKLAKQKARTQAYEMKPLPDSNSDNSKQNQMIGSSTLTLMPTHEVGGRSGNINMGSGQNTSKIEGAGCESEWIASRWSK